MKARTTILALAALTTLSLTALTGAASAVTDTMELGGLHGTEHSDTCNKNPGNNFIIGFSFDAGKALNAVRPICIEAGKILFTFPDIFLAETNAAIATCYRPKLPPSQPHLLKPRKHSRDGEGESHR